MKRDIFLRYNYEIVVYIHMLIRYKEKARML